MQNSFILCNSKCFLKGIFILVSSIICFFGIYIDMFTTARESLVILIGANTSVEITQLLDSEDVDVIVLEGFGAAESRC